MIDFELDLYGDTELLRGIAELEEGFSTFRLPLERSGERVAASIGENIVRGGVPDPFAPLAPSTLYDTAAYRLGGPLYRTGELMEAATATTRRTGSAYELTGEQVTVGLDEDTEIGRIGAILAAGNPEGNLPARPFARVLPSDVDMITEYFAEYVEDLVTRAFRG